MKTRQCVYITGGTSGVGLSLARRYVQHGGNVVLLACDQAKLDAAVAACKAVF